MELQPVLCSDLNPMQREIYNFQKVAAVLADFGFNCIKLADDWQGADFLAYHKDGSQTLKVQLKGRLTIDKKYEGKDLHMCFGVRGQWYLIPNDDLLSIVGETTPWLESDQWLTKGYYNTPQPNAKLVKRLSEFVLDPSQEGL